MDQILDAYFRDFNEQFGLTSLKPETAFEHFCGYHMVSKHYSSRFDPDQICLGGDGDLGIDCIAILVNEHLVSSRRDIDFLQKELRRLDVQFVFVQAKTSSKFDGGDIGTFISGVRQFFNRSLPADANSDVRSLHALKEHIFELAVHMDRNPSCHLYYVTTGIWNNEQALRTRISQGKTDLEALRIFDSVEFNPVDADSLKRIYRELNNKVVRTITFDKYAVLPEIDGVQSAYIGIIPCREYIKLLLNDDGLLNRRLFYDNVRDFQGNNHVNKEIAETIQESDRNDRFALLNNGVTIVAREILPTGPTFKLVDYQIVNGCQTSHILFNHKDLISQAAYLPLKLIATTDGEVTNQIIHGTNSQTEVKREAFESLSPFQKKLEDYYIAAGRGQSEPLLYERRSKQYDYLGVGKDRIVTLATQAKSFLGMFLNEPHSTHRYYGEILNSYGSRIFSDAHSPAPYYVSSVALAKLESLFAAGRISRSLRPLKFQILMILRLQNESGALPKLNNKKIQNYCDQLLEKCQEPSSEFLFMKAAETVEHELGNYKGREAGDRSRSFTEILLSLEHVGLVEPASNEKVFGRVKMFSQTRGFGFIAGDDDVDAFVHHSAILGVSNSDLEPGVRVLYTLAEGPKGPYATEVEVLSEDS